jgi:hypothetical protein
MTTLTYAAVTITLSDDMLWQDEFNWRPVAQAKQFSVGGALLVESALKLAGRPITLSGEETCGWATRTAVEQLLVAVRLPGQVMTLTLRGVAYAVVFDHDSGALEGTPVVGYSDPLGPDFYVVTLRFIEV